MSALIFHLQGLTTSLGHLSAVDEVGGEQKARGMRWDMHSSILECDPCFVTKWKSNEPLFNGYVPLESRDSDPEKRRTREYA
jgi:hypothetical protein